MPGLLHSLALVVLFSGNPVVLQQQQSEDFLLRYGWFRGQVVYFVPFATSNAALAQELNYYVKVTERGANKVEFAPKLDCFRAEDVLNDVFLVNGTQNIVFASHPVQDTQEYTPLWRVRLVHIAPGGPKRSYTDSGDITDALASGDLVEVLLPTKAILDASIVGDETGWRIPQALDFELGLPSSEREVELPIFLVSYANSRREKPKFRWVALVDSSDEALAERLGANYAPRLVNADDGDLEPLSSFERCANPIFAFTWGGVYPTPPGQVPVIDQIIKRHPYTRLNTNQQYNPIKTWLLFDHDALAPSATFLTADAFRNLALTRPETFIELDPAIVTNSPLSKRDEDFSLLPELR